MSRWWIIIGGLLLAAPVQAGRGPAVNHRLQPPVEPNIIVGGAADADWAAARFLPLRDFDFRRDSVMGEQSQAGDTYYDYQTNGQVGKMIEMDDQGGIHVTWMDGFTSDNAGTRMQKYNFLDPETGRWIDDDGVIAPQGTRSGYGSIALTYDHEQRALVFCHATGLIDRIASVCCRDFDRGWGAFDTYLMPNYPEEGVIWPQGVISLRGRIHVVYNGEGADPLSYTTARYDPDAAIQFPDVPIQVSEMDLNCFRIARSPVSERAAIIWSKSRLGIPAPEGWDGFFPYQSNNDLWLATTEDGVNWSFNNPFNVTQCIPPNPELETPEGWGDTLRPTFNFDIIFDYNDFIHIVFEALGMWEKPIWSPDDGGNPWDGFTRDASLLFHWSEEDGEFSPVAEGWFNQYYVNPDHPDPGDPQHLARWPMPGAWKSNACCPSLAYAPNGDLYCTFNYYPYDDNNDYVGSGLVGRCNGDVSVTVSEDNGHSWFHPTRIVETRSHLAGAGAAMCEEYPTLSERIDDNLHIFYILDREAGSTVAGDNGAANTLNPCIYLKVPVDSVARDSIFEGPGFHIGGPHWPPDPVAVKKETTQPPYGFNLVRAFPNPFNSSAQVEFELPQKAVINVILYHFDGRIAKVVFKGDMLAGSHRIELNGADLPTGVYILGLTANGASSMVKLALLR